MVIGIKNIFKRGLITAVISTEMCKFWSYFLPMTVTCNSENNNYWFQVWSTDVKK